MFLRLTGTDKNKRSIYLQCKDITKMEQNTESVNYTQRTYTTINLKNGGWINVLETPDEILNLGELFYKYKTDDGMTHYGGYVFEEL